MGLVSFHKITLDHLRGQKKELPFGIIQQAFSRWLSLPEIKGKIGKSLPGQMNGCQTLLHSSLHDAKVPQSRQDSLGNTLNRFDRPLACHMSLVDPLRQYRLNIYRTNIDFSLAA